MTEPAAGTAGDAVTYLLVDGENIEGSLRSFWRTQFDKDKRPRWDRLNPYVAGLWGGEVKALFFINATSSAPPLPFMQFLTQVGYTPVALAGEPDQQVVDIAIQRTMAAIGERPGDVVLVSHDGGYAGELTSLLDGGRRVAVLGLVEQVSAQLVALKDRGLVLHDSEDHAGVFDAVIPNRMRVIKLADFDPTKYL